MEKPTDGELRVLSAFFQSAAPHLGLFDRKERKLKALATQHPLFQKNLEILRDMVEKKSADLRTIEKYCRLCLKQKRRVSWISEVLPTMVSELDVMDRNLIRPDSTQMHRLLVRQELPVATLTFMANSSVYEGQPTVSYTEEFTMAELVEHFSETFGILRNKENDKAAAGAFTYLLATHSLDAVLFAIDYAADSDRRILSPLDLQDGFLADAEEEIRLREARA